MEIKNNGIRNVDAYRIGSENAKGVTPGKAGATAERPAAAQGDRVSVSPEAMLRTQVHAAASNAPAVRQEKVDAIKERIASGSYVVDSKNIAAKMLQQDALAAGTLKE